MLTCVLVLRPESSDDIPVRESGLQISELAVAADRDALHLAERDCDAVLHSPESGNKTVRAIYSQKWDGVLVRKANLKLVNALESRQGWARETYRFLNILFDSDFNHGRVCWTRVSLPSRASSLEQWIGREDD